MNFRKNDAGRRFSSGSVARQGVWLLVLVGTVFGVGQWAHRPSEAKPAARAVTYSKDVAPIFFKSCAECHRQGEIGPFSVMSYREVRPWAKSIRSSVVSRRCRPGTPIRTTGIGSTTVG